MLSSLSGRSNYLTQFTNWNCQTTKNTGSVLLNVSGQSNYLNQFTNWNLQIAKIARSLLPGLSRWLNYPTQFTNWNLKIVKITSSVLPGLSGWLNYPTQFTNWNLQKLPKLPNQCYPCSLSGQSNYPIYQLNSTNCQNYLNITAPLDSSLFPQTSMSSTSHFKT